MVLGHSQRVLVQGEIEEVILNFSAFIDTECTRSPGLDYSNQDQKSSSRKKRYFRIAIVILVILGLNLAGTWLGHQINFQIFPRHDPVMHAAVMAAMATYILLMATPFMPGIEVGMAVMMLLGHKSALLIYICTLVALSISYLIGRFFPLHLVQRFLQWLYLEKASELVKQLEPLKRYERLDLINKKAPKKIAPLLLNHLYLTIAIILNLPGNALVGGGGGIGLMVGMSGVVPFFKYLVTVAIAVLPVPLIFYLQGI